MNSKDMMTSQYQFNAHVMTSYDVDDVTCGYPGNTGTGVRRKTLPRCNTTKMLDIRNKYKILRSGVGARSCSVTDCEEEDEELGRTRCMSLPLDSSGDGDTLQVSHPGYAHVRRNSFDPYSTFYGV